MKLPNERSDVIDSSGNIVGYHYPAESGDAAYVFDLDPNLIDGETRSDWRWLRLASGDLALVIFPQDDAYLFLESTFQ